MEGAQGHRRATGVLASGRAGLGAGGLIAAGLLVAACSSSSPGAPGTAPAVVAAAAQDQPVGSRMPDPGQDLCRAGELQWLVGKPKTDIPVPVEVVTRRVVCTTCPVTEDYSAYRLNIFFDEQTGIVEQVRCG